MPQQRINSDPKVMMGKPVIGGTRITVELILDKLAAGETVEQILSAHPILTTDGIRAAITFAAKALRADNKAANGMESCSRQTRTSVSSFFANVDSIQG